MFDNTKIGEVYKFNFSIIPYSILTLIVLYLMRKHGIKVTKLIDNKVHDDIEELKIKIGILEDDIDEIKKYLEVN
tara:strand:- start:762 stop:986 length:225 start_codon:yes stop_codon:yes gene_type:complete